MTTKSVYSTLLMETLASTPAPVEVMTMVIELPPGDPGAAPHRHSGPVFGYMIEGEMVFELEGSAPRVIRAGEGFWEPGGDVIHYQAANALSDSWSRFVVVMLGVPGAPMLTYVSEEELVERQGLRVSAG